VTAAVEIGGVPAGTVVEVIGGTLDDLTWSPRRAMVWSKEFALTRIVWLDEFRPTGEEHVADCVAVRVLPDIAPRHLFDLVEYPDWYRPSKSRRRANSYVLQGRHPMGFALGIEQTKCGTCKHLHRHQRTKTYLKCSLTRMTGGPATDVRAKWRGCEKWTN